MVIRVDDIYQSARAGSPATDSSTVLPRARYGHSEKREKSFGGLLTQAG